MRIGVPVVASTLALSGLLASCAQRARQTAHAEVPCPIDSTAARSATLRRATVAELRGENGNPAPGGLVVHVDSSVSQRPVAQASAILERMRIGANTDTAGWAVLAAPAGAYTLQVRRIGYAVQRVPIELRAGYRDTVSLGLGAVRVCVVELLEVHE